MSNQPILNLEFLRKEAKTLLKQRRAGDSDGLCRIRAQHRSFECERLDV
jgi:hypothetical protein